MALEEQIQLYCLNLIKLFFFIILSVSFFFFLYIIYFFQLKEFEISGKEINIIKGSGLKEVSFLILEDKTNLEREIYYNYLRLWNNLYKKINYGEFQFNEPLNLIEITKIISKTSNVYYKFTIIDGWQEFQFNKYSKEIFGKKIKLDYHEILADTYNYISTDTLKKIVDLMKINKNIFFFNYSNNELMKKYTIKEIMIIASLVEKEGIDNFDKKKVSSVILNRLEKKMKLQIDASTIFSITKGKFKFGRNLTYKDLKIKDQYNTYYIYGLPPKPICFVSRKTIEIVLENYRSKHLFYFYDKNLNKHIYSNSFKEHKKKLFDYRKNNA